jgi:predicted N-acetyltransferase YhbS
MRKKRLDGMNHPDKKRRGAGFLQPQDLFLVESDRQSSNLRPPLAQKDQAKSGQCRAQADREWGLSHKCPGQALAPALRGYNTLPNRRFRPARKQPMADSQSLELPLEVIDEGDIGVELDSAIRQLLCACFPSDAEAFSRCRAWNNVRPAFSVFGRKGDKVVCQVGIIERQITCGGVPARVAGIQSMAVSPEWRRSGLSQRLMNAAMHEALRRGLRFGLLFCTPKLKGLYGRMGCRRIDQAVTMRDAAGRPVPLTAKNIAMSLPLTGDPLPSGPIDLEGRDW